MCCIGDKERNPFNIIERIPLLVSVVLGYWIISQIKKNEMKEKRKENPNDVSLLNYGSFHPSF